MFGTPLIFTVFFLTSADVGNWVAHRAAPATLNKALSVAKSETQKCAKPESVRSAKSAIPAAKKSNEFRDEDLTVDNLYVYAEKYIEAYCDQKRLSPTEESRRWNDRWMRGLEQAMNDNIDSDEQSYINRVVVAKRDYFDIERATPERIVEACRLLLRYRDGQLVWLQAMRDATTSENMKKTLKLLAAGPR